MNEFVTKGGKRINAVLDKKTHLYSIQFVPGGELPSELKGVFTSVHRAEQEIINYLANQKKAA